MTNTTKDKLILLLLSPLLFIMIILAILYSPIHYFLTKNNIITDSYNDFDFNTYKETVNNHLKWCNQENKTADEAEFLWNEKYPQMGIRLV